MSLFMQNIHFISIGGAVMHNMALSLQASGHAITGSDDEIFEPSLSRLKNKGLLPEKFGWFPEKIHTGLDAVILGMHARADNPELIKAQQLGLKIYSFPEFVHAHAKDSLRVVIGGSHGKTTTTAMIMHVLKACGKDFDYLVGSRLEGFETMVRLSGAPITVIEGDEYLTSALDKRPKFHLYQANIALLTGIAWDHINVFPTWENYVEQFDIFIRQLPAGAPLAYFAKDETLQQLVAKRPDLLLGAYEALPHRIEDEKTILLHAGKEYPLQVFGLHNLQNMAGAKFVCEQLGITDIQFYEAMTSFGGTANRLEVLEQNDSTIVFRDFAHSPSKLKATIESVKAQYAHRKVIAIFELHTFSSLSRNFLNEYHLSMEKADHAIVYFNQHVFEWKKMPVLDLEEVAEAFGGYVDVYSDADMLSEYLHTIDLANTVLLLMSSGNFNNMEMNFLEGKEE